MVVVVVVVGAPHGASAWLHVPDGGASGAEQSHDGQNRRTVSQFAPSDVPHRHVPEHPGPAVEVVTVWHGDEPVGTP